MQEKLGLPIDLKDSNDQKKILDDFSQKQNQSLEAFRSQFEFIDDDSIKIKETMEQKISNMIKKIKKSESLSSECNIQDTKNVNYEENLDSLETIDLENEKTPNSFWHRNVNLKIETKFDNFLSNSNEEEMDKSDLKQDDFLELLGENIIKYKPTVTTNDVVKNDIDNGACEKLRNAHLDKDENTKNTLLENIEDSQTVDSSHLPGEICDSDDEQIYEKRFHVTKLDVYHQKTEIEIDSTKMENENAEKQSQENRAEESTLVENFELDKSHDYNVYVFKSRYNF